MEPETDERPGEQQLGGVYRDLLQWAGQLPLWQQELLRRVLRKDRIEPEELSHLASAAVAESEFQASAFTPLTASDFPTVASDEKPKRLVAVRGLKQVNALLADQELTFGRHLTVVYGDNGSGKSGYARVLKKVYRARVVDQILGDVCAETPALDAAEATFVLATTEGKQEEVRWTDGVAASGAGRFAVLDAACSSSYIRGGQLAVGPAGIDVPERFADALSSVRSILDQKAKEALRDKGPLRPLEDDTEVGRFISALGSGTSDEAITKACTWGVDDDNELARIETELEELRREAPSARRRRMDTRAKAVEAIADRLGTWAEQTGNSQWLALREARSAVKSAEDVMAATRDGIDEPQKDERSAAWLAMLRAAAGYVGSLGRLVITVPFTVDDRCALCRQDLDDAARKRLEAFERHLRGAAVDAVGVARAKLDERVKNVNRVSARVSAEDEAVLADSTDVLKAVRSFVGVVAANQGDLIHALSAEMDTCELRTPDASVLASLRREVADLRARVATMPASDMEGESRERALAAQAKELRARKTASGLASTVRAFVQGVRNYQSLKTVAASVNTRVASAKASELHSAHMTSRYEGLVREELRELRFRRRLPTLLQETAKAKVKVTPLIGPKLANVPPERVFSEGERTAIALACFLAELRLGEDPSGLVFDDPVSSLDHGVREHVARRLVAAARDRQVIVFTHDLAFLADLREQAVKAQGVELEFRTLESTDSHVGIVVNEEPFGARSISKRLSRLRTLLSDAVKAEKERRLDEFKSKAREFYEALRSTWERFIEEKLFAQVVRRLERNVMPGALQNVPYTKEIAQRVYEGWRQCSNTIEAHDHAAAAGNAIHRVSDMTDDLNRLVEVDKSM